MVKQFETDLAQTDRFEEAAWTRLPWWKKGLAWFAYQFEKYL
jgi:hypothetical protein